MTRAVRRLAVALALVVVGGVTILAVHLDAFAAREWPRAGVLAVHMSRDGRFVVSSSRTGERRRLHLFDLENPLDRWLGARRSLELEPGEHCTAAASPTRVSVYDDERQVMRVVSFESGEVAVLPLLKVVAIDPGTDLLVTRDGRDAPDRSAGVCDYELRPFARPAEVLVRFRELNAAPELSEDGRTCFVIGQSFVAFDTRTWTVRFETPGTPAWKGNTSIGGYWAVEDSGHVWFWNTTPTRPTADRFAPGSSAPSLSVTLGRLETLVRVAQGGRRLVTIQPHQPIRKDRFETEALIRDALVDRPPLLVEVSSFFDASESGPWLASVDLEGQIRFVRIP